MAELYSHRTPTSKVSIPVNRELVINYQANLVAHCQVIEKQLIGSLGNGLLLKIHCAACKVSDGYTGSQLIGHAEL